MMMVPFAFWGIDSYVRGTDHSREVASVGGQSINQVEFNQALRDQQEQIINNIHSDIATPCVMTSDLMCGVSGRPG